MTARLARSNDFILIGEKRDDKGFMEFNLAPVIAGLEIEQGTRRASAGAAGETLFEVLKGVPRGKQRGTLFIRKNGLPGHQDKRFRACYGQVC